MRIRREQPGDVEAVRAVVAAAFARPEAPDDVPVEVTLLDGADALGEPLVALLGEPDYYRRYGFRTSSEHGIAPPDRSWGRYFQVRALTAHHPLAGTFTYAEPFTRL